MKHFYAAAVLAGFGFFSAGAAFGQSMPETGPGGANMQGPQIQPPVRTPDIAPPALPGAGEAPGLATAPKLAPAVTGNPTTALFDAINKNDYNAAQDALSRGADLTAQDPLGETPLELSINLNRNSITFMILAARNETGTDAGGLATGQAVVTAAAPAPVRHHTHVESAMMAAPPASGAPAYGNASGTPNASAGFAGFSGQ
jgi:hypothetical protein